MMNGINDLKKSRTLTGKFIDIPGNMKMYWDVLIILRSKFIRALKKKPNKPKAMVIELVVDFKLVVALSKLFVKLSLGICFGIAFQMFQKSSSKGRLEVLDLIYFGFRKLSIILSLNVC